MINDRNCLLSSIGDASLVVVGDPNRENKLVAAGVFTGFFPFIAVLNFSKRFSMK